MEIYKYMFRRKLPFIIGYLGKWDLSCLVGEASPTGEVPE